MGFLYSQLFVTPAVPTTSAEGQTAIVTGSNTGLGKRLPVTSSLEKGEAAKKDIETTTKCKAGVLEVWQLDLLSYDSVKAFADRASSLKRIDVLLENAGVAGDKSFDRTANGHERMIDVNVISTFYLAMLMLPKLKTSANEFNIQPRLTIVSSEVHGFSKFPERDEPNIFAALDDEKKARLSERYPTSKLLEVLTVREIAPKFEGTGVTLNMANPGLCHSELSRDGSWILEVIKFFIARKTEVGSRTIVAPAFAGPETHGKYFHDGIVGEEHLSKFVTSDEGRKAQVKVWQELREVLEKIQSGVTKHL